MIWAKIVNDEIMQTWDENPAGLWHPDAIVKNELAGHWQEVPDHVNVGWKWKNDQWISGGQWLEEWIVANPISPPGPPGVLVSATVDENRETGIVILRIDQTHVGEYTDWSLTINGETYSASTKDKANKGDTDFNLTFVQTSEPQQLSITASITGPGGVTTLVLEGDDVVIIPERWVPLFARQ